MLFVKRRIPGLDRFNKNNYFNKTKNEIEVRNKQKPLHIFGMEPIRKQGCQIRKTYKNCIKIRITGQGNDENRQKNKKINVNQQRSHLAINTPPLSNKLKLVFQIQRFKRCY